MYIHPPLQFLLGRILALFLLELFAYWDQVDLLGLLPLHILIASVSEFTPDDRFGCCVVLQATVTPPVPNRVQVLIIQVYEGEGVGFLDDRRRNQLDILLDVELESNDANLNSIVVLYRHPVIGILLNLTRLFISLVRIVHIGHISLNIETFLTRFNLTEQLLFFNVRVNILQLELFGGVDAVSVRIHVQNHDSIPIDVLLGAEASKQSLLPDLVEALDGLIL